MLKTRTFHDIAEELDELDDADLAKWFRVITGNYLTPSELVILDAQAAQVESKAKQRELSVLYCVSQPYLSVKLRKLRGKIVSLYNILRQPRLRQEFAIAKKHMTEYQYFLLSLVLAGKVPKEIAHVIETTHVNANMCVNAVFRKVKAAGCLPAIANYLTKYKKNFA